MVALYVPLHDGEFRNYIISFLVRNFKLVLAKATISYEYGAG